MVWDKQIIQCYVPILFGVICAAVSPCSSEPDCRPERDLESETGDAEGLGTHHALPSRLVIGQSPNVKYSHVDVNNKTPIILFFYLCEEEVIIIHFMAKSMWTPYSN